MIVRSIGYTDPASLTVAKLNGILNRAPLWLRWRNATPEQDGGGASPTRPPSFGA